MTDNKNTIIAIVLSAIVLLGWQYFVGMPQMEKQRQEALLKQQQSQQTTPAPAPGSPSTAPVPGAPPAPGQSTAPVPPGTTVPGTATPAGAQTQTRAAVLAATPRIAVETPPRERLDRAQGRAHRRPRAHGLPRDRRPEIARDRAALAVRQPNTRSTPSSAGSRGAGSTAKLPDADTVWRQEGTGSLTQARPVILTFDNGEGLTFRRMISVDDKYMFTVKDEVDQQRH